MLKITKASDPIEVKNLTACIYAVPGVGKSTLGFTADTPLLLDFDRGSYRAGNRGDVVEVDSWSEVSAITADDFSRYRTVVVDTAGRALDSLTADIIAGNPKLGRGGALTLQGYGELKSRFISWTKMIRSFGLDVVLLAHSDEQRNGDEVIERLDVQGGSKNEIYKAADVMGRIYLASGKRMLNFSPTDTAFGKNPAQLAPLPVPNFIESPAFLGDLLNNIRAALNKQSDQQRLAAGILADWKAKIDEAQTVDEFTLLVPETQKANDAVRDNVKRMLTSTAKRKGFIFDKKAGTFAIAQSQAAA